MTDHPHESNTRDREFDIAVIGMAGRFPGAPSIAQFWRNLREGAESIVTHSREELLRAGISRSLLDHPNAVLSSSNLKDIDLFDASFFGYSPSEAELIDPQQRLFLECAWEALENAAYDPFTYSGLIGLFAGAGMNSYLMRLLERGAFPAGEGLQLTIGNDKDYLTTRVSYKLNLLGPSVCVQTACSTSLVAVHLACQSLLAHECDVALAGGVSIRSPQPLAYVSQEGSILSTDGHCRAFDMRATGTVFGNGVGIAVLKRCQEAIDDGDHIYAVIRGSAINNDGSGKVGYTAPSVNGQAAVIRRALAAAGVNPSTISCIEAHGTGTRLGDPIEIAALKQVFSEAKNHTGCAIGTVKTNIGHLDTAAGITGFLKMVLALDNEVIPATLHFQQPNLEMNITGTPFHIVQQATPWARGDCPRRGGVSSFGIGGTNAHVVLEEAPTPPPQVRARDLQLLPLSARSNPAIASASTNLAHYLSERPDANLADIAYTLHVGRAGFSHRCAVVASSSSEAIEALNCVDSGVVCDPALPPSVIFMFPGQGSQHIKMAAGLYEHEPVFRQVVSQCAEAFLPLIGLDLRQLDSADVIRQTRYAQPALFTIEYALARLWMSWGIEPAAMLGHSIGEIVAACLAGVFSLDDAITVVAARAAAMQECPPGAMLVVNLSDRELAGLPSGISLAVQNGPGMAVLSGSYAAIDAFEQELGCRNVACRRLHTSHAYHSELMDAALEPFSRALSRVRLSPPRLRFLSCVTGEWIGAEQAASTDYWVSQLRRTVRFGDGVVAAAALPRPVFLEVGPMQALSKIVRAQHVHAIASLSEPDQEQPDDRTMLQALGELWKRGARVDWKAFHQEEKLRRTPVPSYPFERQRYWYDESSPVSLGANAQQGPYYLPAWKLAVPAGALLPRDVSGLGGWLFFLDDAGIGQKLSESFRRNGARIVTVIAGESFEQIAENAFQIPQGDPAAYGKLLGVLRASDAGLPHSVVHLWGVTGSYDPAAESESALAAGFDSLLLFASGAAAISWTPYMFVVSNRAWRLNVNEALEPAKAAISGILRVVPLEQPGLECRQIDIESCGSGTTPSSLIEFLKDELRGTSADPVVAWRGGNRWVQTLDRITLDGMNTAKAFPERGVYLITGGFGELGLQIAEWLIQHRKARIALLGRRTQPVPPSLAQAEVLTVEADVSSSEQVNAVLDLVESRLGTIDVVLHLAGMPGTGFIQSKTLAEARAVLNPKLDGALNLARALRERGARTLVLFSSTFAIAGGLAQADYSAANACLDAVAHLENTSPMRVLSVNWDGWKSGKWQRQLASVIPEIHAVLEKQRLKNGITVEEAMPALERMLAAGLTQVLFSKQDFPALLAGSRATAHSLLQRLLALRSSAAASPGTERTFVSPRTPTEARIAAIWGEVLGIDSVGATDEFLALGGHSLFAIQIAGRLRAEFQIEFGLREMLECQTVAAVATAIDRKGGIPASDDISDLLDEIAGLSEEDVREQLRNAGHA
jgi:acyl transferase domain-containing protein/NADP-dependent 3-hydroxy acid dehydrogenase YdfG/acyl carrier protein